MSLLTQAGMTTILLVCTSTFSTLASDDRHVRGFWRFCLPHGASGNLRTGCHIMRFTIDASRDRCEAACDRSWTNFGPPVEAN